MESGITPCDATFFTEHHLSSLRRIHMGIEQLYASFLLDRRTGLEIALQADLVIEATPVTTTIQPLPTSVAFLEGIMQLRDAVIPVINLKKRFGLPDAAYGDDAKVAVVQMHSRRYGLLFDDIREVLRVPEKSVEELDSLFIMEDSLISSLIKLNEGTRMLELLDLDRLFPGRMQDLVEAEAEKNISSGTPARSSRYFRYVVFACAGQEYGIQVEKAREICFLSDIDETFHSGVVEGALQLRGRTIPVLNGYQLLGSRSPMEFDEMTRVLVMQSQELSFGIIVDRILEIIVTGEQDILSVPGRDNVFLHGICQYEEQRNILLLDVEKFLAAQLEKIKSLIRLNSGREEEQERGLSAAHHLITENCYLIFSIGRNFAVELKDVQEILETSEILSVPYDGALLHGVINLRGMIVPVLDLHQFYNLEGQEKYSGQVKLIIGRHEGRHVALLVDEIVTIYKQEEFHVTPSLKPELQDKKDTLDRLIEFVGENDLSEHVLVVNIKNIIQNHLELQTEGGVERDETGEERTLAEQSV